MSTRLAFVRLPSPRLAEGLVTHVQRSAIDLDLAGEQWRRYVAALHDHGWRTIEVAPAPDCPDSVFVEDTMVVYGDLAVIARPGAAPRTPETVDAEQAARAVGYRIAHIEAPATLDGGDVLKHDGTVWVGLGGRTSPEAVDQSRRLLAPLDATVVGVPLTKVLHLRSAVTALPDGSIVGYEPLVDDPAVWGNRFLPVPEEAGDHVVILGPSTVLMSSSAPRTAAMFRARGLDVVDVEIGEFEKLEGCVTCVSVRLRGLPS